MNTTVTFNRCCPDSHLVTVSGDGRNIECAETKQKAKTCRFPFRGIENDTSITFNDSLVTVSNEGLTFSMNSDNYCVSTTKYVFLITFIMR